MKLTTLFLFFTLLTSASWGQDSIAPPDPEPFPPKYAEIICWCSREAAFPGGDEAMQQWFYYNSYYPYRVIESNEQGKLYVEFVVETDGSITNIVLEKSVSYSLDRAALRLIRSMPNWEPASYEEKPIREHVRIPITFELI